MKLVRLTVNLNQPTAEALKDLAANKGISYTETIRRAIAILKYLDDQTGEGRMIHIMDGDGRNKKELVMM